VFPDTSVDGDVTTGVSKLMVCQQELGNSTHSAIVDVDQPSNFMKCCLSRDEHRQSTADPKEYSCNLEMIAIDGQGEWTKSDVGDVSL